MHAEGWTIEHEVELRHLRLWIHRKLDRRAINQQLRQVGTLEGRRDRSHEGTNSGHC
jgi:hypothetical protein